MTNTITNVMFLQLFALNNGANATVASGSMGTGAVNTDLSVEMKEFYDKTLIEMAGPELIHDQFAQKRPIPAGGGKTIEFRRYASFPKALTPLQEGVPPTSTVLEASAIKATVDQYGAFSKITDVLELTAIDNNIAEATKLHGRQAGLTLDTITRNAMHMGTRVRYCPSAKTPDTEITSRKNLQADSKLTVDVIMQTVASLRASNAPTIGGKYIGIIHPFVAYDLMRDPEWIEAHKYTDSTKLYNGEIGEIGGVRFIQSSEAKIYSSTGDAAHTPNDSNDVKYDDSVPAGLGVFGTLIFGEGAYGTTEITGGGLKHIFKSKESGGTSNPLEQYSTVGWKATKTAEILIDDYIVRVESCSPKFSANLAAN